MNLNDSSFVWLVTVLAALSLLVCLVVGPRHRSPGLGKYMTQAVSVVVTLALCFASVGAWLNKENKWYTSWGDLFSAGQHQEVQVQDFGQAPQAPAPQGVTAQVATDVQKNPRSNPLFGSQLKDDAVNGQYVSFNVPGQVSGKTVNVMVWLPANYLENPDTFYPVIMGFPGFPGSAQSYESTFHYGDVLHQKAAEGKMRDAIFVVPEISPGNFDSECVDASNPSADAPMVETFVTQDLVPWVKQNLRAIDDPAAWATNGYSAGGWCATMFTVKHPEIFKFALSQAGYFEPIFSKDQQWRPSGDSAYDLPTIVAQTKPDIGIYFFTSENDDLPKASLKRFRDSLQAPTSLTLSTVPVGGHSAEVWIPGVDHGLDWLAQRSVSFAPAT